MKSLVMSMVTGLILIGCGNSGGDTVVRPISVTEEPTPILPGESITITASGEGSTVYNAGGDIIISGGGDVTIGEATRDDGTGAGTGIAPNADGTCPSGYTKASCGYCFPNK